MLVLLFSVNVYRLEDISNGIGVRVCVVNHTRGLFNGLGCHVKGKGRLSRNKPNLHLSLEVTRKRVR